ncbi:MAG: transcription termination factor Rho [Legionellales bacterium]|nr:transcription termination factor Rho [Legionellales bacterium]HAV93537.1 transcription termination factor Rho [Pseudomonadota bacterium]
MNQSSEKAVKNTADIKSMSVQDLHRYAKELAVEATRSTQRQDLIFAIMKKLAQSETALNGEGVLEIMQDGYGFLRSPSGSYLAGADDFYVAPHLIRKFHLKSGDTVSGSIRGPEKGERYFSLTSVDQINYEAPENNKHKLLFRDLTAEFPSERLKLETGNGTTSDVTARMIDMMAPVGKGQRLLIVAPPKTGKTMMLQTMAHSITTNNPECKLIVLMIDERPEEVTEMRRSVKGEVIASTFDESHARHVQVAEMTIARAKRLIEHKHDVVIMLDSITRLARAYNTITPSSGKVLTGGVDSAALQRPKRLFGAARKLMEGGSLTIIGTALIDTGSKMDDFIYEEFKGTGNSEIQLSRTIAQKRIYPAIAIDRSGTRREELILTPEEVNKLWILRKYLQSMDEIVAMEFLINRLRKSKTNVEFLDKMKSGG